MNINSETIFVAIGLIIFAIVITYNGFIVWFRPSRFQDIYVKNFERSPDWWPLRGYYLSWLKSSAFVWIFRLITLIFMLGIILLLVLRILESLDVGF